MTLKGKQLDAFNAAIKSGGDAHAALQKTCEQVESIGRVDPEVPLEILDRFVFGTADIASRSLLLVAQARQLRDAAPPLRAKAEQLHRDATLLFREMEHLLIETQIK